MLEVTSSIDIERDAPSVFAYIADMSNNASWQGGQQSCVWTSEPPHGPGSTYDQVASLMAMLGPVMRRVVQSSVRKDYRQLKAMLESPTG